MKPTRRCKGITKLKNKKYNMSYYCKTHDIYTNKPITLCKDCLRMKQDDKLWCKLINDFN